MSFYGNLEDNKKCAHHASKQIDGLEPSDTSPVHEGGSDGSAHLEMHGEKEFTTTRTRHGWRGNLGPIRREFPMEGVTKKKD